MEPEAYRQMRRFMQAPSPQIPANETSQEHPTPAAEQSAPRQSDWPTPDMNVFRGAQDAEENPANQSAHSGWAERLTAHYKGDRTSDNRPPAQNASIPYLWSMVESGINASSTMDDSSAYPHPELSLPHPSLNLDFRIAVDLKPLISVGSTPLGHRNWISLDGGKWSGTWGSGIVLPGGQDNQLVISDGSARLEANYLLQTYDNPPAYIAVKTHGWRTGPREVLAKLTDPAQADGVDPNSYKFRLFIELDTGDERYKDKINCGMWVGAGMRKGAEVIYDAYRIS